MLKVIGLTGGIASGKTTVANILKELGAEVLDADIAAKEVVEPGKPAWEEIVSFFGNDILLSDNSIDRKKLAEIIFNNPEKKKKLEEIIHPKVISEFSEAIETYRKNNEVSVLVLDVPLLFEANMEKMVDEVWLVEIDPRVQTERLFKRDNITEKEALKRIEAQMPLSEKLERADVVIDGDIPIGKLKRQIKRLWDTLET